MVQSHSPAELTAVQRPCRMAVLAAVVFVMTMVPKIPIPLGYANLVEGAILLIALGFPRRDAALRRPGVGPDRSFGRLCGLGSSHLHYQRVYGLRRHLDVGRPDFFRRRPLHRSYSAQFFAGFDVGRGGLHSGGGPCFTEALPSD